MEVSVLIAYQAETKKLFRKRIPKKYFEYLQNRGIISNEYFDSLKNGSFGLLEENVLFIDNKPFCVESILGASTEDVYDIIRTNEIYEIEPTQGTAFAILYGDDYLFFKPNDIRVYYCNRMDAVPVCIAESYGSFINSIQMEEQL